MPKLAQRSYENLPKNPKEVPTRFSPFSLSLASLSVILPNKPSPSSFLLSLERHSGCVSNISLVSTRPSPWSVLIDRDISGPPIHFSFFLPPFFISLLHLPRTSRYPLVSSWRRLCERFRLPCPRRPATFSYGRPKAWRPPPSRSFTRATVTRYASMTRTQVCGCSLFFSPLPADAPAMFPIWSA